MVNITAPWLVHLFSDLFSVATVTYLVVRRSVIIRTTQHYARVYWLIIGATLLIFSFNTFRLFYEAAGAVETASFQFLDVTANYTSVVGYSVIILYLLSNKIVVRPQPGAGKILVIGAHPDDIEIAAGASLAKLHDSGYKITGLVLSHGERGGLAESRLSEARNGARFLELDEIQIKDFYDTHMDTQATEIVTTIEKMIAQVNPDIIFTHSRHDLHQDHQTVYECTLRATRSLRTTILSYESPSATQEFIPVYFLDVCGYVDVKIEAIEKHWDQHKKPYMEPELIRSKLAVRGSQAKVKYAEGFEVVRMVSKI